MHQHREYAQRKISVHVVDKVRYLVMYKAKLDGFREKMPAHRESICVIRDLIGEKSHCERKESVIKLDEIIHGHEELKQKVVEYERAYQELMRILEGKNEKHMSNVEILEFVKDDLIAKGVSTVIAEEQLLQIKNALLLENKPSGTPTAQMPAFKLDVFEPVSSAAPASDLNPNDPSMSLNQIDDGTPMPKDNQEMARFIPEITRRVVSRSNTSSPVSFLTRRRPLLESKAKSLEYLNLQSQIPP